MSSNQKKMIDALQEQQAHWLTFTSKVMENSLKLFELNARMAKESMEDSSDAMQHLLAAKAPDEVVKLDAKLMQEKLNRMMAYAKEVNAITSGLNAELCQMTQSQLHDVYERTGKLTGGVKSARSEHKQQPFAFMASAFGDASKSYEQWMEAGKKITEAVEHNLADHTLAVTRGPTSSKKKSTKSTPI